jgi:hypothetical protein
MGKHPCTGCTAGYRECAQTWTRGMKCCADCNHPWESDPPWTPEEIAEMQQEAKA